MLDEKDARNKLRLARVMLEEIVKTLDVRTVSCCACGLTKYENRAEYQLGERLNGAIERLTNIDEAITRTNGSNLAAGDKEPAS